jgi:hypothetical protein
MAYSYLIGCREAYCSLGNGAFAVVQFQIRYHPRRTNKRFMPARHGWFPWVDHVTALFILLNTESSSQLMANLHESQALVKSSVAAAITEQNTNLLKPASHTNI